MLLRKDELRIRGYMGTSMRKSDNIVILLLMFLSLALLVSAGVSTYQKKQVELLALKSQELPVTPEQVIGSHPDFNGDPHSPYTLVEFGDYDCPPCHAANRQVQDILKQYGGRLKFVFRNLPLTSIHPRAMSAALAAEAARTQGKFWPVHDTLYSTELSEASIARALASQGVDMARAQQAERATAKEVIADDLKQAKTLGLDSTPSFLLCRPDGKVLVLPMLSSLDSMVE